MKKKEFFCTISPKLFLQRGLIMKGLWFLLFFGVVYGSSIKIELPDEGRDVKITQNFLLFHAFSKAKGGNQVTFSPNLEKDPCLKGSSEALYQFFPLFQAEMGKLVEGETDGLDQSKEKFLRHLDLFEKRLAEEIDLETVLHVAPTLAAVLSQGSPFQPFHSLPLTASDQHNISKIIKSMGDLGWAGLLKHKKAMEKVGDKVVHVHPLRFLSYIVTNPSLKKRLPKIMGDMFKRRGFLHGYGKRTGFSQRMSHELHRGNMMQYVPGFAQAIGIPQRAVMHYFYDHDWEGLIRAVM